MSKFQLYCSCISCKITISVQNITAHINSKHTENLPKTQCMQCDETVYKYKNKFCSSSCGAIYSNSRKDWSKIKTGPAKLAKEERTPRKHRQYIPSIKESKPPYTKVKPCVICNKLHAGYGKSCSKECKGTLISQSIKSAIYNGHDPKQNRGRGKQSWLERSFDEWLKSNNVTNYFTEEPFKRLDLIKTYFADFYFPDKKLIIELDGTQHKKTVEYDIERDSYISHTYGVKIIRISHQEYKKKTRIEEIMKLLDIH